MVFVINKEDLILDATGGNLVAEPNIGMDIVKTLLGGINRHGVVVMALYNGIGPYFLRGVIHVNDGCG